MISILFVNLPNSACGARAYFLFYFAKCIFFAFFSKKICIYKKKVVLLHRETNKDIEY